MGYHNSYSQQQSSVKESKAEDRFFDFIVMLGKLIFMISAEIGRSILNGTFPFVKMGVSLSCMYWVLENHYEYYLFRWFEMARWYPRNQTLYQAYYYFWVSSPLWIWGLVKVVKSQRLKNRVGETMESIGLKNGIRQTPLPIFDQANHHGNSRTLRLKRNGISAQEFEKAKPAMEGAMGVYVDDVIENRRNGTIDIVYSKEPLTSHFELPSPQGLGSLKFVVGKTRIKIVEASFKEMPHMLVAGQTGGGKSTFLRQLITSLYLNNNKLEMTLIDLKGGLEFQLFEALPRVQVIPDLEQAVRALKYLEEQLRARMTQLRARGQSSIDSAATRHLIVVDEAAEVFLGGHDLAPGALVEARRILSQIARQGRAVGIHIVMATQRPDARALNTQVKANLTGTLCFRMPNNTSSVTVLDSGRAASLPDIAGRALWKCGPEMVELQTPYLSPEDVEHYLKPHRKSARSLGRSDAKAEHALGTDSLEIES